MKEKDNSSPSGQEVGQEETINIAIHEEPERNVSEGFTKESDKPSSSSPQQVQMAPKSTEEQGALPNTSLRKEAETLQSKEGRPKSSVDHLKRERSTAQQKKEISIDISADPSKTEERIMPKIQATKTSAEMIKSASKDSGKKGGGALSALAILVALMASGVSGYTYFESQKEGKSTMVPSAETENLAETLATMTALKAKVDQLSLDNAALSKLTEDLARRPAGATGTNNINNEMVNELNKRLTSLAQETNKTAGTLANNNEALKTDLRSLDQNVEQIHQNLNTQKTQLINVNTKTDESRSAISRLETRVAESLLNQESTLSRAKELINTIETAVDVNTLRIAEIRYLLKIAIYKIDFEKDIPTAILSLESAKQLMGNVEGIEFTEALHRLDENLAVLRGIKQINLDQEAEKLMHIAALIYKAPLKDETAIERLKKDFLSQVDENKEKNAQQSWVKNIVTNLTPAFTIDQEKIALPPEAIAKNDAFLLNQNIQLQLSAARVALIQNLPESYHTSIKMAHAWITEFYDDVNPDVAKAREILRTLDEVDLTINLPNLNSILVGFEATLDVRRGN